MLTSIAGPMSNLLMAFIVVFPLQVVFAVGFSSIDTGTGAVYWLFKFLALLFYVNINLAVFNLFPIPPLDGSKILSAVLPTDLYFRFMRYEQFIGLAFLVIVMIFGEKFGEVIGFFTEPISNSMMWIAAKVVGLFL